MATPNIVLTRIDNRLIHGQVGVTWVSSVGANLILVADDDTAGNDLMQQLMEQLQNRLAQRQDSGQFRRQLKQFTKLLKNRKFLSLQKHRKLL